MNKLTYVKVVSVSWMERGRHDFCSEITLFRIFNMGEDEH